MKRLSNFKNTVKKTNESLTKKGLQTLKDKGFFVFLYKTISVLLLMLKRIFREYIPLKIMYILFRDGKIMKKVQGNQMLLDLNDLGIGRELALYGVHEKNSTEEVKSIVKPGMKILEVGANIGYYALLEVKLAGPTGHLYAIEPAPYNFELLKRNIDLNNIKNADLNQAAFGEKRTKTKFYVYDRSNLSSFIKRDDMGMECTEVEVEVLTLDDFIKFKKVDFIRMDVEGYELEILKGARNILSSDEKPKIFFIEVHSELLHMKGSSAREIVEMLGSFGYEVRKSFWRGSMNPCVESSKAMLEHPKLEVGYWETFFELK